MAVFWVDPYINAPIGAIHGTLDGTTRNGTYSYPFSMADLFPDVGTNAAVSINGVAIANNDEIRLKGLPLMDFMLDAGNNFYTPSVTQVRRNTYSAAITAEFAGTNNCLVMALINMPNLINNCIVLSNCAHNTDTGSYNAFNIYGQSPIRAVFGAQYRTTANQTLQVYLVKKQYYISVPSITTTTNSSVYFGNLNRAVTITDGWTSETTRNGVNILCFGTAITSLKTVYFNHSTSNNSSGSDTLYDLPSTSMVFYSSSGGTGAIPFQIYFNSCTKSASSGGINYGNTKTQKFGNIYKIDQGYNQHIGPWTNYAGNDAYSNDSCNNYEINAFGGYYTSPSGGQFGRNVTGTLRNYIAYYGYPYDFGNYNYDPSTGQNRILKIGSMCYNQGDGGIGFVYTNNQVNSLTYEILSNATIFQSSNGPGNFYLNNTGIDPTWIFGSNIQGGPSATTLGPNVLSASSSSSGPFVFSGISNTTTAYNGKLRMNVLAAPTFLNLDGVSSGSNGVTNSVVNSSFGCLNTLGVDYKNTNHNFYVRYQGSMGYTSSGITTDFNYHFSSNTYDKTPIGIAPSASRSNTWHRGVLYYNDSAKTGALCFQSNGYAPSSDIYAKAFEVEIPYYTTQNVKLEIDLETSADWNSNITVTVIYRGIANAITAQQILSTSSAITTKTTYSTTITNATLSSDGLRHVLIRVTFTNGSTYTKKIWVHDVRAVLV